MATIDVTHVSKSFGRRPMKVVALQDLSLSIPEGGIYGLVGPNGAGKSTLLRIIAGLVFPDSGDVRLFGHAATPMLRRRLGVFIEAPTFYPYLTGQELLILLARTSGVRTDPEALLQRVGLAAAATRRVGGYSLGMKHRLAIAAALVGNPEVLVLDEPTNGLDPEGIAAIRILIRDLASDGGLTVIISSHLLGEVERVCNRVAILSKGALAAEGTISDLVGRDARLWLDAVPQQAALKLVGAKGVAVNGGVSVTIKRQEAPALLVALAEAGVQVFEARWERVDLETVFFSQTAPQL